MPQTLEPALEWNEDYAWWPVRSSWSKKRIWLKKFWRGKIYYDVMGRPPVKGNCWEIIYSENEYLLYLMRKEESNDHVPVFKSVRGNNAPRTI
jgi:hypothetical protein